MVLEPRIQKIYIEIQKKLFYMIPEKWNKVYLYSSILEHQNNIQTGELYFYYIPKGVLRKNPINVYEIPNKFTIDENQYLRLVDSLYKEIKKLQQAYIELGKEKWNSVIISIGDFEFRVQYNYEDMTFSSYEKHLIFRYKYLNYSIDSFNKEEKEVINRYLIYNKNNNSKVDEYCEVMYEMPFETIKAGSKKSNIQYVKDDDVLMIENSNTEEKNEIKNQILKTGY